MNQATAILEIEQNGEMLVVRSATDLHDLGELELEGAANELLERMDLFCLSRIWKFAPFGLV
jgi:hypothetical protein